MNENESQSSIPAQKAVEHFQDFNCAQSVFLPFALAWGWDRDAALRVAGAFGGGMGRLQETCGALTGGFMALGLATGQTQAGDAQSKNKTYNRVQELAEQFRKAHGSICCRDLLKVDLRTPEGQKAFSDGNMHTSLCSQFVATAAALTDEILQS